MSTLVTEALASFPPGSPPGPNGLRPCHLRDCGEGATGRSLKLALGNLAEWAIEGPLTEALRETICTANLIHLAKKDGGVRPIVVGDTLRRFIGMWLLHAPQVKLQLRK